MPYKPDSVSTFPTLDDIGDREAFWLNCTSLPSGQHEVFDNRNWKA